MKTNWDLTFFYDSPADRKIERDIKALEAAYRDFAVKYSARRDYFVDETALLRALSDFERLTAEAGSWKPALYFHYRQDLNAADSEATAKLNAIIGRLTRASNEIVFFTLALGKISLPNQKKFLASRKLAPFRHFLWTIFNQAKHQLSEPEEKLLNLEQLPAFMMWLQGQEKLLNSQTVSFGGRELLLSEAMNKVSDLPKKSRRVLNDKIMEKLRAISHFAESELNAVFTHKKIDDELRKFEQPWSATVLNYQNDSRTVETLVKVVSDNFKISQEFYKLKARLIRSPRLSYADRAASLGKVSARFSFKDSVALVLKAFGAADKKFAGVLSRFLENGQIDALPKKGKTGGAYCSGSINTKTMVLLNHVGSADSVMTFGHEMGHAIHTEFSKEAQPPLYRDYSYSSAEIASTLFENFVFERLLSRLSEQEKIIAFHDRLNDDIQTIFRQIAVFNFEADLHAAVRSKGFVPKEEIAELMNKHMTSYLGPVFELKENDGYFFVAWPHIRRFFYVYSYAFGQLVSKAMYALYKNDPKFIENIFRFLSAGGSDTPEKILQSIGIDVTDPKFFKLGLGKISDDTKKLRRMAEAAGMI